MKQKLLLSFLLVSSISFAQAPITQFFNNVESVYAIVDSSTPIDQTATGANLTWSFTNLSQIGTNTDTNAAPTTAEEMTYPNTTEVLTITTSGTGTESKLYVENNAGEISFTGAAQGGELSLIFDQKATLGTFPLNVPFSNVDSSVTGDFSGSADGQDIDGTFVGNLTTTVDTYGTLNLNDFGLGSYSGNVTRLKTVQVIDLFVFVVFFDVQIGTVIQTNYYYYDDSDGRLVFRSSTNDVDIEVAAAGVDIQETIILNEALDRSTLGINSTSFVSNNLKLFPNPVTSNLNIKLLNDSSISSARIMDLNGRTIMTVDDINNSINVSNLQSGMYLIVIESSKGNYTKKFLKK